MFKKVLIPLALLALAACGPAIGSGSAPTLPSLENTTADEKALYVAETAFSVASEAIEKATDAGVLKGEKAAKAASLYGQAFQALKEARAAHEALNSGSTLSQALLVQSLVTQIFGLLA